MAIGEGLGVPGIAKDGEFTGGGPGQFRHVVDHFPGALGMEHFRPDDSSDMAQGKRAVRLEKSVIRHAPPA
jgi:hypothetical protein